MSKASRAAKVVTFSSAAHEETIAEMARTREAVHAPGERIYRATGKIPEEVNVFGKRRVARNSMELVDGKWRLTNGIALPWWNEFDATTSMAENVEKCFYELGTLYDMTGWLRKVWNLQIANAIVQDVDDRTPVFQMTQFESSNLIAKWLRLLLSGENGGDPTEDYDFGEAYGWLAVITDIFTQYAMKGYRFVIGDQAGRGHISSSNLKHHLGIELPNGQGQMDTAEITQALAAMWHQFYLQVATGNRRAERNYITEYWEQAMGKKGHVVLVPRATLLAETQLSIVYMTETPQVSKKEYIDFIREVTRETNEPASQQDAEDIWAAMQTAGIEIGAQTRLPNYNLLPKPGDLFENDRHQWPIGHPKFAENIIPVEEPAATSDTSAPTKKPRERINWSKSGF